MQKYEKLPVLQVPRSKVKQIAQILEFFARTCVCVSVRFRNSGIKQEQFYIFVILMWAGAVV